MQYIVVTGAYVATAGQWYAFSDSQGSLSSQSAAFVLADTGTAQGPSLTIDGAVQVLTSATSIVPIGIVDTTTGDLGSVIIDPSGHLNLSSAGQGIGFQGHAWFENDGQFGVSSRQGGSPVLGVQFTGSGASFLNTGSFTVNNPGGGVSPDIAIEGGSGAYFNSGSINTNGQGFAFYSNLTAPISLTNTGSVIATFGSGGVNTAIQLPTETDLLWFAAPVSIINTGVISGPFSIFGTNAGGARVNLTNSGTLTGWLDLNVGASQSLGHVDGSVIRNTGTINGDLTLDKYGDDTYDGRGGTITGHIVLGSGFDTVFLGAEGETVIGGAGSALVVGGAGNDTISGGSGGGNTISYASATSGVTASLALQGAAQNTGGAGTDTLSSFQNLTGSAFNDLLTGDANANVIAGGSGNDALTGAGGADQFVFGPGAGNDVIVDFAHAEGDRIDLSAFRSLHSLADVEPLLRQSGSSAVLHLPDGGQVTLDNATASALTASDFILAPRFVGDFTGDGTVDLFWQNTANGLVSTWNLNDLSASGVSLPSAAGWQAVDVGDFDGNGYSGDILFRNTSTGKVDIWADTAGHMAGIDVGQATADWNIMGVGDFDGDGKSDILWRNEQNGYVSVWLMNGQQVSSTFNPGQVGLNWKIVGVGDYNGDGISDILWRNTTNGEVDIWSLDAQGHATGVKIARLPSEWQVVGSGDFNGDGKTDVLWRDAATSQVVIWEMAGGQVAATGTVAALGGQWKVAAVVDANGDGKADIVWRDSGTGQVVAWAMDGFRVDHAGVVATADPNWQIVNHHFDWI